jgi:hypothetical protein
MSIPSVPQIFIRPDAINQALRFFWEPPVSDGGSPVTSYFLTDGTLSYTIPATQLSYQVTGLTNGTPYSFTLQASNGNGLSEITPFRTVQPGFVPNTITSVSSILLFGSKYNFTWQSPITTASTLGYLCKAYPVDSNYSTLLDSISTIIKPVNRSVLQKDIELPTTTNWRVGVSAVNDPGYSIQAFSSTLFTATDPKGSIYYNGANKLVTAVDSDLNIITSNFTIEWWQSSAANMYSFYNGTSPNYMLSVYINSTSVVIQLNGTSYTILNVNPTTVWHHFVLQRIGNTFYFFIDGNVVWNKTVSVVLLLSGNLEIAPGMTGYITNFNFVRGAAVYPTTNFLPPRINFSRTLNTKLLLLSRTYEYTYTDSSVFNRTVFPRDLTNNPTTVQWSNYVPPSLPFGSLYYVASNRPFIEVNNSGGNLNPTSGDFSIEFFINVSSVGSGFSGSVLLFQFGNDPNFAGSPFAISLGAGAVNSALYYGGLSQQLFTNLQQNKWVHHIIERYNGSIYTGIGVPSESSNGGIQSNFPLATTFTATTSNLCIGYPISTGMTADNFRFNGAISNIKWLIGRAPYASTIGGSNAGVYTIPTINLPTNQTFGELLLSTSDSNSPFFDYAKRNRTINPFSTIYSTINPFSNY